MENKITLILNEPLWKFAFNKVINTETDKYKSFNKKILIKNELLNHEKITLGIIIRFTKYCGIDTYGELIFGIESEYTLSEESVVMVKTYIYNFLEKYKKENNFKIEVSDESFKKTGCGIIKFALSEDYSTKKPTTLYFKESLTLIYELFFYEIFKKSGSQFIEIEPPNTFDSNDLYNEKVPDWLKDTPLDKDYKKDLNPIKIKEKLSLEDMGGNKELKVEILKLISFYKNKDHFKKWNIEPPRGVILYGPPGTGKTLTAKIISTEIGVNFYTLSSSDIMTKWIGESARNIKKFFKEIVCPCIVFLDELDALAPKRDGNKFGREPHDEQIQVINSILEEIDGFGEKKDILFIGATNRIDAIDPAILRAGRIDYKIFIDYPDFDARKEIWGIYLKKASEKTKYNFLDKNVNLDILAQNTDKFTGSDISEIVRRLLSDYAIGSLISQKVNQIIGGETTFKGLLYLIEKYKNQKILNRGILPLKPENRLSDIGGSKELKNQISLLVKQYKDKELYEKMGATIPRGILLYGPPGTGKTLAAKVIAGEIGEIFYNIKASDIQSSTLNRSVENLKNIFEQIETPCIIFIDEIDGIARNRNDIHIAEDDKKVLNMLLEYIDGFSDKRDILFIGATNNIESLDSAILRAGRMDYKIFVDYPDDEARKEIWNIYFKKAFKTTGYKFLDEKINLDKLSKMSEKFTPSDINEVTRRILNEIAIGKLANLKEKGLIDTNIFQENLYEIIGDYKKEKIVNKELLPQKPENRLCDIGGSKVLKQELLKIINQYKNRDLFYDMGVSLPKGVLLYGPPGTGKTFSAKALVGEIGEIFYNIKASDFLSEWTNGTVTNLKKIFDEFETPCVVFIDEIDAIAKNRNKNGFISEEDIKTLNAFLEYIDGFGDKKDILFIGATNRIEALDPAILRAGRFDTKILVDYPDFEARIEIWKLYIEKSKTKSSGKAIFDEKINFKILSKKSKNFTGSDINEVIRKVKEEFIINNLETKNEIINKSIGLNDILKVLEKYIEENEITKKGDSKIGFDMD